MGSLTFSVNGDDYEAASPTSPVYVRIQLTHGVVLGKTLVDYDDQGSHQNQPIYLAARREGGSTELLNIRPDAIAIVRWIKDEDSIWLAVTHTSSEWLDVDGIPSPPNLQLRVAYTLGVSAKSAHQRNMVSYTNGTSSLPVNTRHIAEVTSGNAVGYGVSTICCADLSNSTINPMPMVGSEVTFDTIHYGPETLGVTTAPDQGSIILGPLLPISASGDDTIGRGQDYVFAQGTPSWDAPPIYQCQNTWLNEEPELCCFSRSFDIQTGQAGRSGNPLQVSLTIGDSNLLGFQIAVDAQGAPLSYLRDGELVYSGQGIGFKDQADGEITCPAASVFQVGSRYFAKKAEFIGSIDEWLFSSVSAELYVSICGPTDQVSEAVEIDVSVFTSTNGTAGYLDVPPYDGTGPACPRPPSVSWPCTTR